jgi:hypothetical protein
MVITSLAPLGGGILILLIVIIFTIIIEDWKIIMAAAITALPFSS